MVSTFLPALDAPNVRSRAQEDRHAAPQGPAPAAEASRGRRGGQCRQGGLVENINLRVTTLRDLAGNVHPVPNGTIEVVTNVTMGYSR